jgi:hypothetical protein
MKLRAATIDGWQSYNALRQVVWVNPAMEDEKVIEWLEQGAPLKPSRRLKRK